MNKELKNSGFIAPVVDKTQWKLGASKMPFVIHQEDGNWFTSLPVKEIQLKSFETYNCTSFNTLSQIECYMFKVFGIKVDYSDRWIGIIAGTQPPGNDPQKIYEAIRQYGLIPDEMLPFSDELKSTQEYYSFKGANKEACYAEGKKWLEKYEFMHEWVFGDGQPMGEKINNMKVALTSAPLALAVYAWFTNEKGVYVSMGPENHWTLIYNIDQLLKIFDSYDPVLKDVEQEINFCKRIYIKEKVAPIVAPTEEVKGEVKTTFWDTITNFFKRLWIKLTQN